MNGRRFALTTRARLAIAFAVVVAILGVLIGTAITHAATYYMTVGQFVPREQSLIGAPVTVSGVIDKASIRYSAAASLLRFTIEDKTGSPTVDAVQVSFHGPEPDDFNYGWPVIVTGSMNPTGTFEASKLLVKCPSKYQAQTRTYTSAG